MNRNAVASFLCLAMVIPVSGIIVLEFITTVPPLPELGDAADFALFDQNNESVSLKSTFLGRVLLIDFIYSSCEDAEFCFLSTHKMTDLQNNLLKRGFTGTDFHLISISFDYKYENSSALKIYSEEHKTNLTVWSFLFTNNRTEIERVGTSYNVTFDYISDLKLMNHSMSRTIVDSNGVIRFHSAKVPVDLNLENIIVQLINQKNVQSLRL